MSENHVPGYVIMRKGKKLGGSGGKNPRGQSELPAHLLGGSGLLMTGTQPGEGFFSEVTKPETHLSPLTQEWFHLVHSAAGWPLRSL